MLGLLAKILHLRRPLNTGDNINSEQNHSQLLLSKDFEKNINILKEALGESKDVVIRKIKIGLDKKVDAAVVYIDGLVDRDLMNRDILTPLMFNLQLTNDKDETNHLRLFEFIKSSVLTVGQVRSAKNINEIVATVLSGNTVIIAEGMEQAMDIDMRGWKTRAIEESQTEVSIRGPRDSFTETLRTNTALLRRKIRDPNLTFDYVQIGQRSKTDVLIVYIKGIIPDSLVTEVKQRLEQINVDAILDTGYIEQFIEDNPWSIFPTVGSTERPDVLASHLLEGRAAIMVDGSPMALTVPFVLIQAFQNPDDYYARPYFASFIRWIRLLGFLLSVYLPGIYVSLSAFHPELYPTPLLITVASAREGIPFPVAIEALLMLILFEILREAGLRMPRSLGQAVSIVGALVIGQAAVSAGLVGAPMVIIVATTAITSFLVVPFADLGALFRFILTIAAGFLGLFGMLLISIEILSQLAALRSFGVPYLSPVSPLHYKDLKDVFLRAPLWAMDNRPVSLNPLDSRRQSTDQMPRATRNNSNKRKK